MTKQEIIDNYNFIKEKAVEVTLEFVGRKDGRTPYKEGAGPSEINEKTFTCYYGYYGDYDDPNYYTTCVTLPTSLLFFNNSELSYAISSEIYDYEEKELERDRVAREAKEKEMEEKEKALYEKLKAKYGND